jgi:Methyltransferase domain
MRSREPVRGGAKLDPYRERFSREPTPISRARPWADLIPLRRYDPPVSRVVGLDSSSELLRLATSRVAHSRIPVSLVRASAQHVPFADNDLGCDSDNLELPDPDESAVARNRKGYGCFL